MLIYLVKSLIIISLVILKGVKNLYGLTTLQILYSVQNDKMVYWLC